MYVLYLFYFITTVLNNLSTALGNNTVSIENYAFQLTVLRRRSFIFRDPHICGAALITKNAAISAASCFKNGEYYKVRAGVNTPGHGGTVIAVKKVVKHPKYKCGFQQCDYDLAVLILKDSFTLSNKIQPIRMAQSMQVPYGVQSGIISGWGMIRKNAAVSVYAKLSTVNLVFIKCPTWLSEQIYCVESDDNTDKSVDMGAPFVLNGVLFGVVSDRGNCCINTLLITSVPRLGDFIRNITGV